MKNKVTPRVALLQAISIAGNKAALCREAKINRKGLNDILEKSKNKNDDEDIMEPRTAKKIEKAVGIPWKTFAPASFKFLTS